MKCSSLAALEVVKMTTSSAASDENFVKMTTFLFQCHWHCRLRHECPSVREVSLKDMGKLSFDSAKG